MGPMRKILSEACVSKRLTLGLVALILFLSFSAMETSAADAKSTHAGGLASVYSAESGTKTASGERLNSGAMTAAHRTLPFDTMVRVTNERNGRSAVVRINDRGPFLRGRVIDVSPAAARALGFSGVAPVSLNVDQ
jgi:rare lipoprotein A